MAGRCPHRGKPIRLREELRDRGHELVTAHALYRPVRDILAFLGDLLHPHRHIRSHKLAQMGKVAAGPRQTIDVIDPKPLNSAGFDLPRNPAMGKLEYSYIFLTNTYQTTDIKNLL